MSSPWLSDKPILAQTTGVSSGAITSAPSAAIAQSPFWMYGTLMLFLLLGGTLVLGKLQFSKKQKELDFEQYKNKDLKKKLKLALVTIRRMETNPDLVHARGFNLDYLRMRMDEEVFHYVIVNQIKMKVNQLIAAALRPSTDNVQAGIVAGGRQIDEIFDVTYEVETQAGKWNKGILFRIQIKLTKLPTQSSSNTVSQIINCIETFLAPLADRENWQPAIQGHVVLMSWDQKAKPTPLLVIEQSEEGNNVIFRTKSIRSASQSSLPMNSGELSKR